ncbi:uncharacterized protein RAG0_05484 [Rhynchosporium agropyri]|uniref:Extracellular membrane protein CFEM domain-containing protein n=1 Tax=Rhynchosporium agropyri TaxID=914238 RepID=A0A1E1KD84_9HELO|nr:uncharacterized protein RAG0_05484 [Rhynchosporium agropyri]
MQLSLLPVSLLLSLATAQSTVSFSSKPVTSTECAGRGVLDSCVASTKAIVADCGSTDWGCLCQKWNDVLTCYTASGCVNDPTIPTAQNSKDTYCANASIYPSSTSSPTSRASASTTATTTQSGTMPAQTTSGTGSVRTATTSGGAAASPTQSGSGAVREGVVGAGSVLMGVVGLMGALL